MPMSTPDESERPQQTVIRRTANPHPMSAGWLTALTELKAAAETSAPPPAPAEART